MRITQGYLKDHTKFDSGFRTFIILDELDNGEAFAFCPTNLTSGWILTGPPTSLEIADKISSIRLGRETPLVMAEVLPQISKILDSNIEIYTRHGAKFDRQEAQEVSQKLAMILNAPRSRGRARKRTLPT